MITIHLKNRNEIVCESKNSQISISLNLHSCPVAELSSILNFNLKFPYSHSRMGISLGLNEEELWGTIPQNVKKEYVDSILSLVSSLDCETSKYLESFSKIKHFLRNLSKANYDVDLLIKTLENHASDGKAKEIRENPRLLDEKIIYSNSKTTTGRLTVVSGLNVLTLPADFKKAIKPTRPGGSIAQIDIISAEPKIAWNMTGKKSIVDIYDEISKICYDGHLNREIAKQATICALYGQSPRKLAQILPLDVNANKLISSIRETLGFNSLVSKLEGNSFRNILGRPLRSNSKDSHSLKVSHFLQSSAADLSILLFSDFCDRVGVRAVPLFVIHDALIVDCDQELTEFLEQKKIIKLKHEDHEMHAKATILRK